MVAIIPNHACAWDGPFEILNETFFDGDWSDATKEYNLPPPCGCPRRGGSDVITRVYCCYDNYRQRYHCSVYIREYNGCSYKENERFGDTICYGEGCWVYMMTGGRYVIEQSAYDKLTNTTRKLLAEKGILTVPNGWEPYMGYPDDPYDVRIQNSGVVWGYVGIYFDKLSTIDGEYCIPNKDAIKVHSGAWDSVASNKNKKKRSQRRTWSVTSKTTTEIKNGIINAKIDITVKWCQYDRDGEGNTQYQNTTSRATFYDRKPMPRIVPGTFVPSAVINSYNNSVSPYSSIKVIIDEKNTTSTNIAYKNTTATYYNQLGRLVVDDEEKLKYFSFMNDTSIWLPDQGNKITRRAGYYIINEAPLDLNELKITVSTPYETTVCRNYNVTVIDSKLSDFYDVKGIVLLLSMIGVFAFGAYMAIKGAKK